MSKGRSRPEGHHRLARDSRKIGIGYLDCRQATQIACAEDPPYENVAHAELPLTRNLRPSHRLVSGYKRPVTPQVAPPDDPGRTGANFVQQQVMVVNQVNASTNQGEYLVEGHGSPQY